MQIRLTQPQIDDLVTHYRAGRSVRELVQLYGANKTTIVGHLKKRGVPTRGFTRKLTDTDVVEAARLYAAGDSLATLGDRFGVNPETVRRELKRAGVVMRPQGKKR